MALLVSACGNSSVDSADLPTPPPNPPPEAVEGVPEPALSKLSAALQWIARGEPNRLTGSRFQCIFGNRDPEAPGTMIGVFPTVELDAQAGFEADVEALGGRVTGRLQPRRETITLFINLPARQLAALARLPGLIHATHDICSETDPMELEGLDDED